MKNTSTGEPLLSNPPEETTVQNKEISDNRIPKLTDLNGVGRVCLRLDN